MDKDTKRGQFFFFKKITPFIQVTIDWNKTVKQIEWKHPVALQWVMVMNWQGVRVTTVSVMLQPPVNPLTPLAGQSRYRAARMPFSRSHHNPNVTLSTLVSRASEVKCVCHQSWIVRSKKLREYQSSSLNNRWNVVKKASIKYLSIYLSIYW